MGDNLPARYIWMDGAYVPWDEARIHVATDCIKRGSSVFDGLSAYWNSEAKELFVVKLQEHLDRLWQTAKVMRMTPPCTRAEMEAACVALLAKNEIHTDAALHPTLYHGVSQGYFGYTPDRVQIGAFVTAVPRPVTAAIKTGQHLCVSAWARISDRAMPPRLKVAANLHNSRLAAVQASEDGYDGALFLDERGQVTQAQFAHVFLVRDGVPITPPVTSSIIDGITRRTLIRLFQDELGLTTEERAVDRTELYLADEVFLCGTGAEVTPVLSVDRYPVGSGEPGALTQQIGALYRRVVRGQEARYRPWLTPVYRSQ